MTHLRRSLAPAEESEPGADSRVAAETPLAELGRGRLVITHSGVLNETESVFSAGASAGDLLGILKAERTQHKECVQACTPHSTETDGSRQAKPENLLTQMLVAGWLFKS